MTMTATEMDPVIRHAIGKALANIGADLMATYANGATNGTNGAPVKRGPGRPRRAAAEATPAPVAEAPVRRGPGRPRKNAAPAPVPAPIEAGEAPKRGRGRPRKDATAPAPVAAVPSAPIVKGSPNRSVLVRRPGGPKATVYHDAANPCGLVRNPADNDTIPESEAIARGMTPCKRCAAPAAAAA